MANRRSTVQFTDVTEPILKQFELAGFDIKSVVNGGLVVLNKLTGDEQKQAIVEANGIGLEKLELPESEFRRRVLQILDEALRIGGQKKHDRRARNPKSP